MEDQGYSTVFMHTNEIPWSEPDVFDTLYDMNEGCFTLGCGGYEEFTMKPIYIQSLNIYTPEISRECWGVSYGWPPDSSQPV